MSFEVRTYDAIVRDLLTSLTGGRVAETIPVPPGPGPLELPPFAERPARRISHVEGFVQAPRAEPEEGEGDGAPQRELVRYRFTPADYVLEPGPDGAAGGRLRFRPGGRRPAPGSMLTVNYYPEQTRPVPLTDLQAGSVVRTLLETVAREMAMGYHQLDHVYRSAFLETAEGAALDKVVALVGVQRLPAGHPLVKVRLARRAATPGRITVPAGTAVTDRDGNRYLAAQDVTFEANEEHREALFVGESSGTEEADAGAIDRLETMIAGISTVTNPQPAWRPSSAESDADLRRRAGGALHAVRVGTVDALRYGLRSDPNVKDAQIIEHPRDVPGEVKIDLVLADDADAGAVAERIERLRPAGIRVITGQPDMRRAEVDVRLVLAGSGVDAEQRAALKAKARAEVERHLTGVPPGTHVRQAKVLAAVLTDDRVSDAEVVFRFADGTTARELELREGELLEVTALRIAEPKAEDAEPRSVAVNGVVPIHLAPGITAAEARIALSDAFDAHLATRDWQTPLTVDGLLAAVRDENRYAAVRERVTITIETGGTFHHLVDGEGLFAPAREDTLVRGDGLTIEVLEGSV